MSGDVIVTVTLNAALSVDYAVGDTGAEGIRAVSKPGYRAGGRGVTVARVLRAFGHDVLAAGLAGGVSGELIREDLAKSGVPTAFTLIRGESRRVFRFAGPHPDGAENADGEVLRFGEAGPYITTEELGRFAADYRRLLAGAAAVVLCGSLSDGLPSDIYGSLVTYAAEAGVPVILDAGGDELKHAVGHGPDLVVAETGSAAPDLGAVLLRLGAGAAAVTTGHEVRVVTADGGWTARLETADLGVSHPPDRGALVAGLVPGLLLGWSWPDRLRHALALAAGGARVPGGLEGRNHVDLAGLRTPAGRGTGRSGALKRPPSRDPKEPRRAAAVAYPARMSTDDGQEPDIASLFAPIAVTDTFAGVLSEARDVLGQLDDPVDAELWGSDLIGALSASATGQASLTDALTGSLVPAAEAARTPEALALLRVLAAVGPPVLRDVAGQAAARVRAEGVADPVWAGGLGQPQVRDCWHYADVGGRQESLTMTFAYGTRPHTVSVLIDHGRGGKIRDAWVAKGTDLRADTEQAADRDPLVVFEPLDATQARIRLERAVAAGECAEQPDQVDDVVAHRALVHSRLNLLTETERPLSDQIQIGKWPLPSRVVIHWTSVKSVIEPGPDRPQPLSLTPPSGSCGSSAMVWLLTCTAPASICRASANPRWLSPVISPALSP